MAFGPLEFIVIGITGNKFTGEIAPELAALRKAGVIRLIDLVFVMKDQDGEVTLTEATDLTGTEAEQYGAIVEDVLALLTEDDVRKVSAEIPPNSSALIALFEHTWAARLAETIRNADGVVLSQGRVAQEDLDIVVAELAAAQVPAS